MKWFAILLLVKTVFCADQNPDENRGIHDPKLFEGDMILTPKQRYRAEHGMDIDSDRKRASIRTGRLWPGGVVVYAVQSALSGNSRAWAAIRAGISEWTTKTCIRFRPRQNNEASYVYFRSGRSSVCSSYVGRTGRRQDITLGRRCWIRGIVAHEIGHAIGFLHEQSRPDRDNFVTIVWANIPSNRRNNFLKYGRSTIDSLGTPYDYGSVMHYGSKAFSRNGKPTILVKQKAVIGQRRGLSATDAKQADLLYNSLCPSAPITPVSPTAPTTVLSGCNNYRNLTDFDREKDYRTPGNVAKCDRNLQKAWYRFTGAAGTQMPTQVVPINHCGTHATGWLSGGHPAVGQGAVQRRVCFHWAGRDRRRRRYDRPCMWSVNILVENCGAFFVYEFIPINRCSLRYCSDNLKAPTTLPTPAPTTPPSGCHNYKNLTDFDREKDYGTPRNVAKCDRTLQKAWYRFTGAAGTQMPTQVVPINHCGTHATGWLSGGHPAVGQGAVQRRVCFHWAGRDRRRRRYDRPCMWSVNILVENCGAFFVYEFIPINRCSLRYCSDNLKAPATLPLPAPTTPPSAPTTAPTQAPSTIRTQAPATTSTRVPPPITTTAICRDGSPSCGFFKSLQYCNRFPYIRDVLCKRSCNTC